MNKTKHTETEISEAAMQTAMSFKPFIDPKCQQHDEIVKDMAKSIQRVIDRSKVGYMKVDKLCAAAPELLEALSPFAELLKQFDGQIGMRPTEGIIQAWHHNKHGESSLTVEMLQKAFDAIKKATT